jgi:hypothetical protein
MVSAKKQWTFMELEMRAASPRVSLCHELCLLGVSLEKARGVSSSTPFAL